MRADRLDLLRCGPRRADAAQTVVLDEAIHHTLRFLPWPLNEIVKRILTG